MSTYENRHVGEIHGCIVCGTLFNILAVYSPGGRLVDCTVTSPGGRIVPDEHKPLVACQSHTVEEIKDAHNRWLSRDATGGDVGQEEE